MERSIKLRSHSAEGVTCLGQRDHCKPHNWDWWAVAGPTNHRPEQDGRFGELIPRLPLGWIIRSRRLPSALLSTRMGEQMTF